MPERDLNDLAREEGPEAVRERLARGEKVNGGKKVKSELAWLDMSKWDSEPVPEREWLVPDRIPLRQVTLISGQGAIGKSILLLQLLASTSLNQKWLDLFSPEPGPTIYLGAEDEQDEIHRRLAAILRHYRASFADLITGGFRALAYAGKDAVLAEFNRNRRIQPTKLFDQLYREACALLPKAIVLDTVSDVFLGDEIKRDEVRQFGSLMRRLAIDSSSAVVISSHPSQTGLKSGTGLSGSTQWHNTVRARAYFKRPKSDDDEDDDSAPDDGLRELQFLKNRRSVTDKKGPSYAPAKFAEQPEAKAQRISSKMIAAAMERLLSMNRIRVITEGPPSKPRTRIVEVET